MKRFGIVATLGIAIVLPVEIRSSGLLFNYSNSVPFGVYRRVVARSNRAALYAGFCLPDATAKSAIHAGLEIVPGACARGLAPVLKPLSQASPEHPISLTDCGFFIDGKLLANTAPKSRSRTGAVLVHYPFGTYTNGLWAVSNFNPNSYDSRYFGPVAPDAILFYAKPVWTW